MGLHEEFNIIIDNGGVTEHIYDQEFMEKTHDESDEILNIRRASNVEPDTENPGEWYVDLSPVNGPLLKGFKDRNTALKAEVAWLNENFFTFK